MSTRRINATRGGTRPSSRPRGASRGRRACPPGPPATRAARAMALDSQRARRRQAGGTPRRAGARLVAATADGAALRNCWTCRSTVRSSRSGRDDVVDEADFLRARRRESRAAQAQLARGRLRPILRTTYGEIIAGRMPSVDLREAEHGVFGGDDDVADGRQPAAAAERRAVDAADERARAASRAPGTSPRARPASREVLVARVADHLRHPLHVRAGARRPSPRPDEHDRAHGAVGGHVRGPLGQARAISSSLNALRTSGRLSVTVVDRAAGETRID